MKKILIGILAMATFGCLVTSCNNDDKQPIPPQFAGFKITPEKVHPGDIVTISACYVNKGENIYGPHCNWTLTLDTLNENNEVGQYKIARQVNASIADDNLSLKIAIPKSAKTGKNASCTLNIDYTHSADAKNIGFELSNPTQNGYRGNFQNSRVVSVLYTRVNGSVSFPIVEAPAIGE